MGIYGDIYESRRFVRVRNNVCLGTGFWYTGQCLQNRMVHNSIHLFDIHEMRIENYDIVTFAVYWGGGGGGGGGVSDGHWRTQMN